MFKQNLKTTGEDVSPSANLAAVYDHLQETSEYWDSKPVNELTFADLKHKCAYNWIHFKTRGHMTKTPPASPGKLGSAAAERVNFTICPVEQSHVPMEPQQSARSTPVLGIATSQEQERAVDPPLAQAAVNG